MSKSLRVLVWLGVAALVGLGLFRLRFDVDVLNLLPTDIPEVRGLQIYQQHFANANELVLTIKSSEAERAEAAARQLAELLRDRTNLVASAAWQTPWIEHPGQATELAAYFWLNQPPEVFAQLTNRFAETNLAPLLSAARERLTTSLSPEDIARLSYDPFGLLDLPQNSLSTANRQELFSSEDGTFRIVFVRPDTPLKNYRDNIEWVTQIKTLVAEFQKQYPVLSGAEIRFTGGPAFTAEISSGMQSDITKSVASTLVIIVGLFWWAHRRFRPLLWLVALLLLILAATLALGGMIFGTLGVVSVGFAAILLGLAVDYGLVLYQEFLFAPQKTPRELRSLLAPSIIWSAVTTAGAFATLNLGGLPGLGQLGSLVAIGVALAAVVMLNLYLPPLARWSSGFSLPDRAPKHELQPRRANMLAWVATVLILLIAALVLSRGVPKFERTADSLRPRKSEAYEAMDEIKKQVGGARDLLWLVIAGRDENEIAQRLETVESTLVHAQSNQQISSFALPTAIWPQPQFQLANRAAAEVLAAKKDSLRSAMLTNGFTAQSFAATERVLDFWQRAVNARNVIWPSNEVSSWVLDKLAARTPTNFYALGLVHVNSESGAWWNASLPENTWLSGWQLLGPALSRIVQRDLWRVMAPMFLLLAISLWLAFRTVREVLLSVATLLFSGVCLWTLMRLAGWSWNLMNMMALPLLFGVGVDYSIHTQLALRRHGGNISETRKVIGRALLLCAGTTIAGFGSNIWSSNAGLVSLGQVSAAGIAFTYLTSNFLLPIWWRTLVGSKGARLFEPQHNGVKESAAGHRPALQDGKPSVLYRAGFWRVGLAAVRILSQSLTRVLAGWLARIYWLFASRRRQVVIENLLPIFSGNRREATRAARELFQNFAVKLLDLWRFEGGQPVTHLFSEMIGWEFIAEALAQKRGILFVTPHLGNWEFGSPIMTMRGVDIHVITQAEPQAQLTELRQKSRARQKIQTLVIGEDPFAFVEIIRRLEGGAAVALLVDRPPEHSSVQVELLGRPYRASIAPAELARASGCVILPGYIIHDKKSYVAKILPPVPYNRAALRDPKNRREFVQQIMRALEPVIRQHATQWYQFVPVWPKN